MPILLSPSSWKAGELALHSTTSVSIYEKKEVEVKAIDFFSPPEQYVMTYLVVGVKRTLASI